MSLEQEFIEAQQSLDGLIKYLANKYTEKFEKLNLFGKEFIADAGSFSALDDIDFDDRHLLFPEEFLKPGPGSPVPDLWVDDYKVVYDIDVRDVSQVLREDLRLLVRLVTEDVFVGDTDVLEKTIVEGFRIDIVDTESAAGTITGFGYTRTTDKPMLVIEMNPILGPEDNFLLQQGNFLANSYIEEFYPQNKSTRLAVLKGEIPLINTQEGSYGKKIDMLKYHTTENPYIGPKQKADMLKMLEISKNEELSFAADLPTPSQIDRATNLIDIEDTPEGVASDIVPNDISNIDTPTNVVDDLTELENSIRTKYSDYLEEDTIKGYSASLENPFKADVPSYEKRGIQLDYFEGNPTKNFPYNKDTLFIKYLYIDETQRGQGIGSQIFDEIKQFADDNGLYIRLKNDQNFNTSFWEKKGFGIYEGDKSADYSFARLDDYVLAPEGETLPNTPNRLDTPGGSLGAAKLNDPLVFDSWVDNLGRTTASFVDNLPLETVVKNRVKNLIAKKSAQAATPGGIMDAVDAWEFAVMGLMAATVAFSEIEEVSTIVSNTAINMFNNMTSFYGIPPVPKEEYDLDYEFITKVLDTGEKYLLTDIILNKGVEEFKEGQEAGVDISAGLGAQVGVFDNSITTPVKTDTMETTQKIQPGVQEEKMFEQAKPKKSKPTGGAGAKIL